MRRVGVGRLEEGWRSGDEGEGRGVVGAKGWRKEEGGREGEGGEEERKEGRKREGRKEEGRKKGGEGRET